VIPPAVERRARWVLDTLGAREARFGDDVPYSPRAWEQLERGERPQGDELADAFFHLARLEERGAPRDAHGRFPASASCLDPLRPPLERLRERLGLQAPRWAGARFAVALTHDVDIPWRWTRIGVRGAAARLRDNVRAARIGTAAREARGLAAVPVHRVRGTDPNWRFDRILATERERGARSTFFVMAAHRHRADGPSPEAYDRLRPRLVDTIRDGGAEVGLHGSYAAAVDEGFLADEKERLEALAGPVAGQRYHFLRLDPHANLAALERLGFAYDASLGFAETPGFRAGIAHPFRPWDAARERPLDLVEIPLAAMDATFEDRYLGLSAKQAEPVLMGLLDWASEHGGAFSVLWHTNRFDRATSAGWDRLYERVVDGVHERGGACVSAGELADEMRRSSEGRPQG
jgi:peptidoglycan/xylan/chitin deacetylase (PgdA/CDA1 family)